MFTKFVLFNNQETVNSHLKFITFDVTSQYDTEMSN